MDGYLLIYHQTNFPGGVFKPKGPLMKFPWVWCSKLHPTAFAATLSLVSRPHLSWEEWSGHETKPPSRDSWIRAHPLSNELSKALGQWLPIHTKRKLHCQKWRSHWSKRLLILAKEEQMVYPVSTKIFLQPSLKVTMLLAPFWFTHYLPMSHLFCSNCTQSLMRSQYSHQGKSFVVRNGGPT